jgi:hypothetical protein
VRPHEIDSRPFVSIYRKLQYGPAENVRKNPARTSRRRGNSGTGSPKDTRQGFVDRQKSGDKPVTMREFFLGFVSASLFFGNDESDPGY